MKKLILLFLVLFVSKTNAQTLTQNNWTSYCGWINGANSKPAWGGWAREFAQRQTGMFLVDSITKQLDTTLLNNCYNKLAELDTTIDMMQADGGLGSGRDSTGVISFMNMIESDSAKFWKNLIYKQCYKLAQLPNSKNRLYYQLGNEISSAVYSETIRYWNGLPYNTGITNDPYIIPYFVENFIAPTIEAIDSASLDYFGQKGMINICMGSLANAGNSNSPLFLSALLNYTITGTYAPSLAGKKVYELIHIITIHYMMGGGETQNWNNTINTFGSWMGTGRIRGIWSSEEVGIKASDKGEGAAIGATATCRYLKWSIDNNYTARTARTNYYGWKNGPANTTVNDFNSELFNFLGNVKLQYVDSAYTSYANPSAIEWYGFLNDTMNKGILVTLLKKTFPATSDQSLTQIKLDKNGWGNINNVTLTRYDSTGNVNIPVSVIYSTDSVTVTFSSQSLFSGSVLLLKINTQQLITEVPNMIVSTLSTPAFNIYPNPSGTSFNVVVPDEFKNSNYKLIIYNSIGQMVYQNKINCSSKEIQVSSTEFPSGHYNIVLSNNEITRSKKIIIKQ